MCLHSLRMFFGATPAGTDETFFHCGGMSHLHGGSAVSTILNWEIGTKSCFIEPFKLMKALREHLVHISSPCPSCVDKMSKVFQVNLPSVSQRFCEAAKSRTRFS